MRGKQGDATRSAPRQAGDHEVARRLKCKDAEEQRLMNRPAVVCRLEIKVFQGRQTWSQPGLLLVAGVRNPHSQTHGVRFPPPPHPAPLRKRERKAPADPRRVAASRERRGPVLAPRPGPQGARICRSGRGRGRRWSSGNVLRQAPRSRRLTPKRQRRPKSTLHEGTTGSPGRYSFHRFGFRYSCIVQAFPRPCAQWPEAAQ